VTEYEFMPTEILSEDDDDGTMVDNVARLASSVVGHRIAEVRVGRTLNSRYQGVHYSGIHDLTLTLDNGRVVTVANTDDCCAHTVLDAFLWNADAIDHVITGVRTEDGYTKWYIYADLGDLLELTVSWSAGNPFYYGYGFEITVTDPAVQS